MKTFPIESENYLRGFQNKSHHLHHPHPIFANKDIRNMIIDILINMRKQEITKEVANMLSTIPWFYCSDGIYGSDGQKLVCNGRDYILEANRCPTYKMKVDAIRQNDQSIKITYQMSHYFDHLSQRNEIRMCQKLGWEILFVRNMFGIGVICTYTPK